MTANDLKFEDIYVGMKAEFTASFNESDIKKFAELSGDYGAIHVDTEYAKATSFKKIILHGMLVGSLCSRLVGMYLPGKHCLDVGQRLLFRKPVYPDEQLTVTGMVLRKSPSTRLITIQISIKRNNEEVLSSEAMIKVME